MSESGSYDLLVRKDGWKAVAALIVSPYVEREFFETVARELRPKRMHVVIDDGCRREDIRTVEDAVAGCGRKRPPVLSCKLGSATGLVHVKLFYVLWQTPGGQAAHSLVFGSANATRQGFSGRHNAELVTSVRLAASRHAGIIRWCEAMIAATWSKAPVTVPMVRDARLAPGINLRLPAIEVGRDVPAVSNFDLWLQRGYLLSDYRPDPGFLSVPIALAKGMPQTQLADIATESGFAVRQTKRLRYPYVSGAVDFDDDDDDGSDAEEHGLGNWRRKLFVWTNLGDWCSGECHDAHEKEFKRRGHEDREEALRQLEALREPSAHAEAKERFLVALGDLWERFGEAAPSLLKGGTDLDRATYADLFDQRVERDLELASDPEFSKRFVRGFELVEVPRFRNDVVGWRNWVDSLFRQLVLDEAKGRSQSLLLRAMREGLTNSGAKKGAWDGHRPLVDALRLMWAHPGKSARAETAAVSRYHVSPKAA